MDKAAEQPAALNPDQAHRILGRKVISRGSFYHAINRGEIPHIRLGKRILIPRRAFMDWLESAGGAGSAAVGQPAEVVGQ